MKLSPPQREMLTRFAGFSDGEGVLRGQGHRTGASLVKLGLLEPVGYSGRWHRITDAGREAVAALALDESARPARAGEEA